MNKKNEFSPTKEEKNIIITISSAITSAITGYLIFNNSTSHFLGDLSKIQNILFLIIVSACVFGIFYIFILMLYFISQIINYILERFFEPFDKIIKIIIKPNKISKINFEINLDTPKKVAFYLFIISLVILLGVKNYVSDLIKLIFIFVISIPISYHFNK